ncbi:MAG: hypothetical protein GY835_22375 [bacterium]|nr:hypothetical protein [bacterium]
MNRTDESQTLRFSDWECTREELVLSWLSLLQLEPEEVILNIGEGRAVALSRRGWAQDIWGYITNRHIIDRIRGNPHDFGIAYGVGVDVMSRGKCVEPANLSGMLAKQRACNSVDDLFTQAAIAEALRSLDEGIQAENERRESAEAARMAAEARKWDYEASPALLRSPWAWLTTQYGIADGEVYVRKSILGIKFGDRRSMRIENVTRTHATGTLWGKVVFGEGSAEPVVWEGLFRPEATLRRVKDIVKELQGREA